MADDRNKNDTICRPTGSIVLRPYQEAAREAAWTYWQNGGGNPLIEIATGGGKSLVIGEMVRRLMASASRRILILTHVKELIEQDVKALLTAWPGAPVGICCAGLGQRNVDAPIVIGSIQSVHRDPKALGPRNLVIVDEAHLIPAKGEGMYVRTIAALRELYPQMRVVGLTATPFRLDSGRLDEGDGRLFDRVVFTYDVGEAIADGWLAPLVGKPTATEIDTSGVARRGGEFVAGALEDAADIEAVVAAAADEIVTHGRDRRAWLCFCTGVRHATHVRDALRERGIAAEMVIGGTPRRERDAIFAAFRSGAIRSLVGCGVFTTGFDAPGVDLIAMLRPTLSAGLFVQMLGRGSRPVFPEGFNPNEASIEERLGAIAGSSKADCMVLDFAGNAARHGPVDAVKPRDAPKARGVGGDEGEAGEGGPKECPRCGERNSAKARVCRSCGAMLTVPHEGISEQVAILSRELTWVRADSFSLHRHMKRDAGPFDRPTLRVDYRCGRVTHSEWIALEHNAARSIAGAKWHALGGFDSVPATVAEAISRQGDLYTDVEILLQRDGRYWRVVRKRMWAPALGAAGIPDQVEEARR
jgi:DNA repair protein RadD